MRRKITKKFGLFTLVLITINSILGSGIFLLPGVIYRSMAGNFWTALAIATLMTIVLCAVFSFAAKLVKKSAGTFAYVKAGLGNFWGAVVGIMKAFTTIVVVATLANASVSQISKYSVSLDGNAINYTSDNYWIGWLIIFAILAIYTIIVNAKNKIVGTFTTVVTITKLAPIILLIILGFGVIGNFPDNFKSFTPTTIKDGVASTTSQITGTITGILALFYAYIGYDSLANSTESYKNPERNIPIALTITVTILAIIYTLLLVIGIGALPKEILQNPNKSILAEAARVTAMGEFGFHFVMLGASISMLGILFMATYYVPHVFARMAKDGLMPRLFAVQNKQGSYSFGSLFGLLASIILITSGSFKFLLQLNVLSRFIQFIPTCIAVLILKRKDKELMANTKPWISKFVDISCYISIILLAGLMIIKIVPIDGVNKTYYKSLREVGYSLGFFIVAIIISYFYSSYNMRLVDNKNTEKLFIGDKNDWQFKIKSIMLWIFAPLFMFKKEKLNNFKDFYKQDKLDFSKQVSQLKVKLFEEKDSKEYNKYVLAKNEGLIEQTVYDKYDSLLANNSNVNIFKVSNIHISSESGYASFSVQFEVKDRSIFKEKTQFYKYNSLINKIAVN